MLNKTLFLEIDKPNYVPIYTVQYDYNSRFYEITILNNSQPLDLTGIRVIVAGKKPDGKEVFNSCKVLDAKKGLIQLELTEQMNAVNGASEYALELFSADGMLSSQPFKLIVTRSTISKSVESSKELGALKDALNEVQDIDNRFAQTNAQLSQKANVNEVVKKGYGTLNDFNEETRRIIQGMDAGEINAVLGEGNVRTKNLADSAVSFAKLDGDIKSKVGTLEESYTEVLHSIGYITKDGNLQDFSAYHYKTLNVAPGQILYVTSKCVGESGALAVFYDNDENFISNYKKVSEYGKVLYIDEQVIVPDNCYIVKICSYHDTDVVIKESGFVNVLKIKDKVENLQEQSNYATSELDKLENGGMTAKMTNYLVDNNPDNLYKWDKTPIVNLTRNTTSGLLQSSTITSFILPIERGKTYTIEKMSSSRFNVFRTAEYPAEGVAVTSYDMVGNGTVHTFIAGENEKYVCVGYYYPSGDTAVTEEEIRLSIRFYEGEQAGDTDWKIKFPQLAVTLDNLDFLVDYPLLSDALIKKLSNKQLGKLTKGYICLSADDGHGTAVVENTLPIIKSENVPCTFALWSSCDLVRLHLTELREMLTDYKCSIAQHGPRSFLNYEKNQLIDFLHSEQEAWKSLDLPVSGVCYPDHEHDEYVMAVCGAMYGVCCGGGMTTNEFQAKNTIFYYETAVQDSRSNMYELYRVSLKSYPEDNLKSAIDYISQNGGLLNLFWHDISLTEEYQTKLIDIINYAKSKSIEFITVGDILKII